MLTDKRAVYRPFIYPKAFDFFQSQQQAHWIPTEVRMASDIKDYNEKLTNAEKHVVTKILRLFTTLEIDAEEYWSLVAKWFGGHPEIQQMATTNSSFEAIHIWGYDYLTQSLNLPLSEYEEFLKDPAMLAKKQRLGNILSDTETLEGKALSLAVANIVAWSVRDESLHSESGCWLFRTLVEERPELFTQELQDKILDAARVAVSLEDDYIDSVFSQGEIESISSKDLKAYVRFRANTKLADLGMRKNWKNIDIEAVKRITSWFDVMVTNQTHDFFDSKGVDYAKGNVNWDGINFSENKYA